MPIPFNLAAHSRTLPHFQLSNLLVFRLDQDIGKMGESGITKDTCGICCIAVVAVGHDHEQGQPQNALSWSTPRIPFGAS